MDKQLATVEQRTNTVETWAQNLKVTNQEEYELAYAEVKTIKELINKIIDYWKKPKTKAYGAWKEIVAKEKDMLDVCKKAETTAKQKADAWFREEERKAEAERQRLQAAADETTRKEQERLTKEAEKLKTPEKKQAKLEVAESITSPVINVEKPQQAQGVAYKKTWKARLDNIDELIAAAKPGSSAATFLEFNSSAADSFARSTKGAVAVPGVTFYEETSSAVRRR